MTVLLKKITIAELPVLERMFQYYLYDMSKYAGWPLTADGCFAYPSDLLPPYFSKQNHHPYFILDDGEIAGFCLVRCSPDDAHIFDMGQFFVLGQFQKRNIGRTAFDAALSMHLGQWQVRVLPENKPAYQFWKTCIAAVSDGQYSETSQKYADLQMTHFTFDARA